MRMHLARERIYRVLLNNPGGIPRQRIAADAGASTSQVSRELCLLKAGGMVTGTVVTRYREIAELWVKARSRPDVRDYMVWGDPLEVLKGAGMRYALTTYRAENMVQGHVFPAHTDFYVMADDFARWHRILCSDGLVAARGRGANVGVWRADEHVFYGASERDGMCRVSVPQLIVDLMTREWPATEAAAMLISGEERACALGAYAGASADDPGRGAGAGGRGGICTAHAALNPTVL